MGSRLDPPFPFALGNPFRLSLLSGPSLPFDGVDRKVGTGWKRGKGRVRSRWNIPWVCFSRPARGLVRTRGPPVSSILIGPRAGRGVCVDSSHPPSFHERRRITTPRPTSAIHVAKSGGSGTRSPSVRGNKEKDGGREVPNPNVRIESEAGGETSEERKPKVGRERGRNTPWTATERASR